MQSKFAGYHHASLPLLLVFFGVTIASPTSPLPISRTALPDITTIAAMAGNMMTTGTTDSTSTSTHQFLLSQNISQEAKSHGVDADPPAIVNNENVTETEIVITEARHGKSLHHPNQENSTHTHEQQNLISRTTNESDNSTSNVTSTEKGVPGSFETKLATDGDHTIQHLSEGDAPSKPEGKPQVLQEQHLLFVTTTEKVQTERDKMVQRIFGGTCGFAHWNRCSRLEFWGDEYLVPDKKNPGNFIVKRNRINCREKPTLCLKNGWTVARCHMLCMSQVRSYYNFYDWVYQAI